MDFAAKPASKVINARPMKVVKDAVCILIKQRPRGYTGISKRLTAEKEN